MTKRSLLATAGETADSLSSNTKTVVCFARYAGLDPVSSTGKETGEQRGQKIFFAFASLFLPLMAQAEVPKWKILPEKSNITFTATQNNAPVTGEFKTFTGEINFDPLQLSVSNVTITVDMASVTTSYAEIAKTLKTAEWFNVVQFPNATFKATSFNKIGDTTYQANGMLTLRDKTAPLNLTFDLQTVTKTTSVAKGEATLQRSTFGVGRGEWASTDQVSDDIKINFTLTATKQ